MAPSSLAHTELGTPNHLIREPLCPQLYIPKSEMHLSGIQAVSITDSYRLTMTVMFTKKEIILLDIGSHDEVSCGTSRTVSVTIIPRTVTDGEGRIETIVIKTYHCESCHSFVRSTEGEPAIP